MSDPTHARNTAEAATNTASAMIFTTTSAAFSVALSFVPAISSPATTAAALDPSPRPCGIALWARKRSGGSSPAPAASNAAAFDRHGWSFFRRPR